MNRGMGHLAGMVGLLSACQAERGPSIPATRARDVHALTLVSKPAIDSATAFRTLERVIAETRLTTLKPPCYVFEDMDGSPAYSFVVREHHTPKCGGDPETGPRLFTVYYDTAKASVSTDNDNVSTGDTAMYVIARNVRPAK